MQRTAHRNRQRKLPPAYHRPTQTSRGRQAANENFRRTAANNVKLVQLCQNRPKCCILSIIQGPHYTSKNGRFNLLTEILTRNMRKIMRQIPRQKMRKNRPFFKRRAGENRRPVVGFPFLNENRRPTSPHTSAFLHERGHYTTGRGIRLTVALVHSPIPSSTTVLRLQSSVLRRDSRSSHLATPEDTQDFQNFSSPLHAPQRLPQRTDLRTANAPEDRGLRTEDRR